MLTRNNEPGTDEGHDGFVWSQRARAVYAVLLALALALAVAAPTLAAGEFFFGK